MPRNLWILEKKIFYIEGMKYCKKLIVRDYLIILEALEKAYPQYIMQKKKHSVKLTSRKLRLIIHVTIYSKIR